MSCNTQSNQPNYPFLLSASEARKLAPDGKYTWYLYTDGSSHLDHIGGFAAIAYSKPLGNLRIPCVGCCTHTETGRAELLAVLNGLHAILDSVPAYAKTSTLLTWRPTVLVVTDRQDLAGSINGVFAKNSNGDLWAQMEWYQRHFKIDAVHIPRETSSRQHTADVHASSMRVVLCEYVQTQTETDHL